MLVQAYNIKRDRNGRFHVGVTTSAVSRGQLSVSLYSSLLRRKKTKQTNNCDRKQIIFFFFCKTLNANKRVLAHASMMSVYTPVLCIGRVPTTEIDIPCIEDTREVARLCFPFNIIFFLYHRLEVSLCIGFHTTSHDKRSTDTIIF